MKKLQLFLSISLLFVLGFQLNAQTVEEIIAKHETAMGGAQKWSGLKSLRSISKFSMQGMDIQTTMNMLAGKAIKVEVEVMGNKMITCFDGSGAWMLRPAMMGGTDKPEDLPQEQVGSLKSQIFPGSALMKARAEGNAIEVESKEKFLEKHKEVVKLLKRGLSLRQISKLTDGTSTTTIMKVKGRLNQ